MFLKLKLKLLVETGESPPELSSIRSYNSTSTTSSVPEWRYYHPPEPPPAIRLSNAIFPALTGSMVLGLLSTLRKDKLLLKRYLYSDYLKLLPVLSKSSHHQKICKLTCTSLLVLLVHYSTSTTAWG